MQQWKTLVNQAWMMIMDAQSNSLLHREEPTPLLLEVQNHEEEKEAVTFWKKENSVQLQVSETDSEGAHFYQKDPCPSSSSYYRDGSPISAFSDTFIQREGSFLENVNKQSESESTTTPPPPIKKISQHRLQSVSQFFTEEEIKLMDPPDTVLSIEDKYFVVLPNDGAPFQTLFCSLLQTISGKEKHYEKLRENVVNYICSQEGWDLFGNHLVTFYENSFDEFRFVNGAEHYGSEECDRFQQRIYRHYIMNEESEGSLVELAAASILYKFSYTCLLLQETEDGKGTCRIFHSFEDKRVTTTKESLTRQNKYIGGPTQTRHFLRVGDSPDDWRWTLVIPFQIDNISGKAKDSACHSEGITKGSYQAQLWNVYGLTWNNGDYFPSVKKSSNNYFSWKNGTSVIYTSSGKLLGGYVTLGKDLFSNLCYFLPNDLHLDNHCCLQDVVRYCPLHFRCADFNDPVKMSDIIAKNKEYKMKKCQRKKIKNNQDAIGTLKDLQRASIIFSFGYYVLSIDEKGKLQILGRCERDNKIYLLARTRQGVVTDWCALGDMDAFKSPSSLVNPVLELWSSGLEIQDNSQSDQGLLIRKKKSAWRHYYYKFSSFRISISKYFAYLRLFFRRVKNRNRVHHVKCFPLSDNEIINDTVISSVIK